MQTLGIELSRRGREAEAHWGLVEHPCALNPNALEGNHILILDHTAQENPTAEVASLKLKVRKYLEV